MILLAALVGLFTVAWTTSAHAEFITLAILSYLAGSAVAASFTTGLITLAWTAAASIGLSYLTGALTGKPEEPIGASSGQMQGGGLVPRSAIFGRGMTAGSLVYANTFGYAGNTPNAYLVQVIALQDLPASTLAEIWVNGEKSAWNAGATAETEGIPVPFGSVSGGQGGGSTANHMWVRFYNGSQIAADARLVTLFGANPDRPYESTRIGTGVAYVVVTTLVNEELFQGFPELKFALDGVKLYDQRLDTTQGGSGAHRLTDPTTWAHTRNPVVIAANIVLGIQYADRWVYGAQTVAQPQLPTASWFAAANECDAAIDLAAGGTEPQFQAGGEILFNQQPADTIEALLKSCNGRLAEIGGVYKIRAGAAGASVIAFTDADIYSSEQQTYDPFVGLGQTINAVNGRYISAAEGWELKDAVALLDADLELADGGRRQSVDVVYGFVSSGTAVQRLMRSERDTNRAWRRHTLPMPPDMYVAEPLDVVSWTSTRNGYINKTFEIVAAEDDLDMVVSLKELDPTSYDWDPNVHEGFVSEGTITYLNPQSQAIIAPHAEGILIEANGRQLPGLLLTWDPNVTDVDGILYEVRLASDQSVVLTSQTDYWDRGALKTSQNLVGATNYEARLKYRPASARQTTYSGWLAFTTPDVRINQSQLDAELAAHIAWLETRVGELLAQVRKRADQAAAAASDLFESVREMTAQTTIVAGAQYQENKASAEIALFAAADAAGSIAALTIDVETNYATTIEATNIAAAAEASAIFAASSNAVEAIAAYDITVAATFETKSLVGTRISDASVVTVATALSNADEAIAANNVILTTTYITPAAVAAADVAVRALAVSDTTSAISAYNVTVQANYATPSNVATAKSEAISAAGTNANSAIAAYNLTVIATYATPGNVATAKTQAIDAAGVNANGAIATSMRTVFVENAYGYVGTMFSMAAGALPSGAYVASIGLQIKISGTWFPAGMWIESYYDNGLYYGQIRLQANRLKITTAADDPGEFVFEQGTINGVTGTVLRSAKIGDLAVGTLKLENESVIIADNQYLGYNASSSSSNQVTFLEHSFTFVGSPGSLIRIFGICEIASAHAVGGGGGQSIIKCILNDSAEIKSTIVRYTNPGIYVTTTHIVKWLVSATGAPQTINLKWKVSSNLGGQAATVAAGSDSYAQIAKK